MSKHALNKFKKITGKELIGKVIPIFNQKLYSYLHIESSKADELANSFLIKSEMSGHNNQICLIDLYDSEKRYVGGVCLKYSPGKEKIESLHTEFDILNILCSSGIPCPQVIDSEFQNNEFPYLLMEIAKGECIYNHTIDIQTAQLVLDAIQAHELVLMDNLETSQLSNFVPNIDQKIDFENKLSSFLQKFTPNFIVRDSYNFLNENLNDLDVVRKRKIVTDRSTENIFIDNDQIIMIDFSTIRIGTQFDNWIQFIDDPLARFSCTKKELIELFFKKNKLQKKEINLYYISAIYTNLLQGIFTYHNNYQLSRQYINNVNGYFQKFTKKKGVLIEINHQHT